MPRPTKKTKAKHAKVEGVKEEKKDTRAGHPYARPTKAERPARPRADKPVKDERSKPERKDKKEDFFHVEGAEKSGKLPSDTGAKAAKKERPFKALNKDKPTQARYDRGEKPGKPYKPDFKTEGIKKPFKPKAKPIQPKEPQAQPEASTSAIPIPSGPTPEEIAALPKSKRPKQPFTPKQPPPGTALVIKDSSEPIPSAEVLGKLRRLDLLNAGFEDVSWLKDAQSLTWLNLNGNPVTKGWDVVGKLSELTVLNISNTGVVEMPIPLRRLKSLKAFVATGNPWQQLNEHVVGEWTELNSLILSHSPNLSLLPPTLATLKHLAKLSLSHCPALTTSSFPDLSPLPVLRDLKLNHCSHLDALPTHLSAWGTGSLGANKGSGHGLEVIDLGSCNLTYQTLNDTFLQPRKPWTSLRSLTVQQNPLSQSHPDYAQTLVQQGDSLPKLQIVDAKRVVERKRKGEVTEKKQRVPKVKEVRITGANGQMEGERRQWGPAVAEEDSTQAVPQETPTEDGEGKKKKKSRKVQDAGLETLSATAVDAEHKQKKAKKSADTAVEPEAAPAHIAPEPTRASEPVAVPEATPTQEADTPAKSRSNATMKTSILKVIDVAPAKRKTTNLAAEFAKKPEADNGLGVGGW